MVRASRMGVGRTGSGHKGQHLILIHLHRFAGGQILRHQNDRLRKASICLPSGQDGCHPVCNILDIRRPRPEVFILHLGKKGGEVLPGGCDGIFRIDLLGGDPIADRIIEIIILQQHGMNLENGCIFLSYLLKSRLIDLLQLLNSRVPRRLIAGDFRLCVLYLTALDQAFLFPVIQDLAHSNSIVNRLSGNLLHSLPLSAIRRLPTHERTRCKHVRNSVV